MAQILLVHHAAQRQPHTPPNSLSALQACLDAGGRLVEIDISPLADGTFALLHGPLLDRATNGSGLISERHPHQLGSLRLTHDGILTDEPIGLLHQALERLARHPTLVELQLDLKPHAYLTPLTLARLVEALTPVRDRVRVTSVADWSLRYLHTLDPALPLGFDPLLYLDVRPDRGTPPRPPLRQGAYGYWDDHPLATRRWGPAADYLAARAEALWTQAPPGVIWYIHAGLLTRALDDGFDWIAHLHARGAQVDAWTLDADQPGHLDIARRLIAAGVDRITTNDAPALAAALGDHVAY